MAAHPGTKMAGYCPFVGIRKEKIGPMGRIGWGGGVLGAEDFFHGFALGEFVDEFIEVADLAHGGVCDSFDADAADGAFDEGASGIGFGGFVEEGLEVGFFFDV